MPPPALHNPQLTPPPPRKLYITTSAPPIWRFLLSLRPPASNVAAPSSASGPNTINPVLVPIPTPPSALLALCGADVDMWIPNSARGGGVGVVLDTYKPHGALSLGGPASSVEANLDNNLGARVGGNGEKNAAQGPEGEAEDLEEEEGINDVIFRALNVTNSTSSRQGPGQEAKTTAVEAITTVVIATISLARLAKLQIGLYFSPHQQDNHQHQLPTTNDAAISILLMPVDAPHDLMPALDKLVGEIEIQRQQKEARRLQQQPQQRHVTNGGRGSSGAGEISDTQRLSQQQQQKYLKLLSLMSSQPPLRLHS
ncbi:hypothetical protein BDZ91DRAFT_720682 [Kalaharituber pfeilii]|nr:hypothetical protein BDZ91DRAFT_720682 [Kalaharituber pfeilii]